MVIDAAMASRTAWAPWPVRAGPLWTRCCSPWPPAFPIPDYYEFSAPSHRHQPATDLPADQLAVYATSGGYSVLRPGGGSFCGCDCGRAGAADWQGGRYRGGGCRSDCDSRAWVRVRRVAALCRSVRAFEGDGCCRPGAGVLRGGRSRGGNAGRVRDPGLQSVNGAGVGPSRTRTRRGRRLLPAWCWGSSRWPFPRWECRPRARSRPAIRQRRWGRPIPDPNTL